MYLLHSVAAGNVVSKVLCTVVLRHDSGNNNAYTRPDEHIGELVFQIALESSWSNLV